LLCKSPNGPHQHIWLILGDVAWHA